MNKPLETIGLFDGISCLQETLRQLDIPVGNYYASEIESKPIKVTQDRFPETIQVGSVTSLRIPKGKIIDLIGGGVSLSRLFLCGFGFKFQ